MVGTDLWALNNEINKLLAYSPKNPIGIKAVQALVLGKIDENIFHLLDAILARNQGLALKLLHYNLVNGLYPAQFIGMIIGQFRMLLVLKDRSLKDSFLNSRALAVEYKWHPYTVQKNLVWLRQYSLERLREIYQKLEDLDVLLKTTSHTEARFELFMAELLK
jgi:DNA polymerase-3 subunit delta